MIVQASFFWQNDRPDGLGFTLNAASGWSPHELTAVFNEVFVQQYFRDSDAELGRGVVAHYLQQLRAIAFMKPHLDMPNVIIAGLNIMWLSKRGFIRSDEFNGALFIRSV